MLTSLVLVTVSGDQASAATPPDQAALAHMDSVIRDGMQRSGMPGFAVAVASGDRVVHARGFGDAGEGRRVTPQTPFLLGSVSKSFTALAAMQLVDAGRLQLDAPASRYVPEFQLADRGAAERITVRQVLQQTTGLPATAGGPVVRSAVDGTALQALRELRDARLATPPGTAFHYSNGNYVLAGLIVARASGEPYAITLIVVSGALLMATGALRLVRLSRRSAEILDQAPSSGTALAQAAPTPASVPS